MAEKEQGTGMRFHGTREDISNSLGHMYLSRLSHSLSLHIYIYTPIFLLEAQTHLVARTVVNGAAFCSENRREHLFILTQDKNEIKLK